jgi:hypothetical protein
MKRRKKTRSFIKVNKVLFGYSIVVLTLISEHYAKQTLKLILRPLLHSFVWRWHSAQHLDTGTVLDMHDGRDAKASLIAPFTILSTSTGVS